MKGISLHTRYIRFAILKSEKSGCTGTPSNFEMGSLWAPSSELIKALWTINVAKLKPVMKASYPARWPPQFDCFGSFFESFLDFLESEDFSDSSEAVSGNGSGRKSDSIPEVPLELSILVALGLNFLSKVCVEFDFETSSVPTSLVEKSESRVSSLNCCRYHFFPAPEI